MGRLKITRGTSLTGARARIYGLVVVAVALLDALVLTPLEAQVLEPLVGSTAVSFLLRVAVVIALVVGCAVAFRDRTPAAAR